MKLPFNSRPFPRRIVAVAVEGTATRSVTVRGGRVIAWETAETGARLSRRANRANTVADAPLDAVLLRYAEIRAVPHRHVRDVLLAEIQERLPFALDRMDVALAWRTGGIGMQGAAAAIAKDALDRHTRHLAEAGVAAGRIYPRASALGALAPSGAAIVLHLTEERLDLVRTQDGVPLLTHSIRIPAIPAPAREGAGLTSLIANAAERIAGAGDLADAASSPPPAVILTGALATLERASDLTDALGTPVSLAAPALSWPQDFPLQSYAAALGLALAAQRDPRNARRSAGVSWQPLDILPPRYRPEPRLLRPAIAVTIAAAFVLGGYSLQGLASRADTHAAEIQAYVTRLEMAQRSRTLERAQISALEQRASLTGLRIQELETLPVQQGQRMALLLQRMQLIAEEADTLRLQLSQKNFDASLISIAGAAPDFARVSSYAAALQESALFSQVRIVAADLRDAGGQQGQAGLAASRVEFQIQASVFEAVSPAARSFPPTAAR